MAKDLDAQVEAFGTRPLNVGPYTFVTADALTMKVREGGRVVKVAAIGATLAGTGWQRCRTHFAANLMSVSPKHAWGGLKALLHSVYDEPDSKAVHAQFDRVVADLAG